MFLVFWVLLSKAARVGMEQRESPSGCAVNAFQLCLCNLPLLLCAAVPQFPCSAKLLQAWLFSALGLLPCMGSLE